MTVYGYARVSTNGQDLALQEEALLAAGCTKIFAEKKSGAHSTDRAKLQRLLTVVDQGDIVLVTRLDRLARSTLDLLHTIDRISKAGAAFRSLAEAWCDTTTPQGKLILTVLAGMAEFERSLIMARTQAGIEKARTLGVIFGRRPKLNPRQRRIIAERYAKGETMAAIAEDFGVSEPTIWRALRKEKDAAD
jgi:DNA invertase Pin-like site-specific DNA recombinase